MNPRNIALSFFLCLFLPATLLAAENPSGLTEDNKEFMLKAAQGGMTEVALGKLAAEKGSTAQVRDFGKSMVKDHGKINAEMEALAKKKGVSLPSSLDAKHQAKVDKLAKLSGKEFDEEYISCMKEMHKDDLDAFEDELEDSKDPDLKAALTQAVTIIKSHVEHLKKIQS